MVERLERIGRYTILCRLGRGGMGEVYQARAADGSVVAVKLLRAAEAASEVDLERFAREGAILGRLQHPALVCALSGIEIEDGLAHYAMEYVAGRDLAKVLRDNPAGLEPKRALEIALEVLEGLQYAHEQGVLHRDVKPSNILIEESGRARLADFGLARLAGPGSLTRTGVLLGTPEYMSPEQADGQEPDRRSDLYSLGIVLYEMLTGRPPFSAERPLAVLRMHHRQPAPPLPAELPRGLPGIVAKALRKNPDDRWPTAAALAAALRCISVPIEPPSVPTSSAETRELRPDSMAATETELPAAPPVASRRGWALAVVALCALLALWATSGLWGTVSSAGPPADDGQWEVELLSGERATGSLELIDVRAGRLYLREPSGALRSFAFSNLRGYRRTDEPSP